MKRKIKLLAGVIAVLSLTMVSLTGCVFYDDSAGVWRSWGPNGDNQNYTGIDSNENGFFYFRDGVLDWNYNGMACNEYGWWHITNGVVELNYTGMDCNEFGWWYFRNGQLDWNYTGFAQNFFGTWLYQNGRMNLDYNGFYEDYLIENSRVKSEFTGIYDNKYVENGKINYNFTGVVDGVQVVNGIVDPSIHVHNFVVKNAVEATCSTEGYTGDQICTTCGEVIKGTVIPKNPTNHKHTIYTPAVTEKIERSDIVGKCIVRFCNICGEPMWQTGDDERGIHLQQGVATHLNSKHGYHIITSEDVDEGRATKEEFDAQDFDWIDKQIGSRIIDGYTEEIVITPAHTHCNDCGAEW